MPPVTARSLMFVPGNRPALLAKVGRSRPDAVVVDLEDAVSPADKPTARQLTFDALGADRPGAGLVLVRVNPVGTPWHADDLAAAAAATRDGSLDGIVLPKYEDVEQLQAVRHALPTAARVVVGIESALGVGDARALLAERPDAVYFGAEDLIADLGGRRTDDGLEVLYARSQVRLAAHVAHVPAIDQAVVAVQDAERFFIDAARGRDLGYQGKICLHPTQVEAAHRVFTPTTAEIDHARAVLVAAQEGVGVVGGVMVDAVHVRMAKDLLARAEES